MLGETLERIGGKAEEERLASGLDKFLKMGETIVKDVFGAIDRFVGGDKK